VKGRAQAVEPLAIGGQRLLDPGEGRRKYAIIHKSLTNRTN
jgi:hypothetical protein